MGYLKIISGILIVFVAIMGFKHGMDEIRNSSAIGDAKMLSWGIGKPVQIIINTSTMLMSLMILFPQTFYVGNIIGAIIFVLLMWYQIQSGNYKAALTEIPFLLIIFLMLYLGYPLKK